MSLRAGELEGRIAKVAAALFELPPERAAKLVDFVARVDRTNKQLDLTAARTADELVDLLLADALVLASRLPRDASVVDVGTGAGAPGLPLAVARPDLRVTLVEPMQKRVSFVRTAAGAVLTGAAMPRVVRARGEELAAKGERFDVAISRATLPPSEWLELGARLAPEVWVLLAKAEPPEGSALAVAEDMHYQWPLTCTPRRAVQFRRP